MILLLVIPAWIAVLSLVVGLCASARAGDVQPVVVDMQPMAHAPVAAEWELAEPVAA